MNLSRKIVPVCATVLFLSWFALNFSRLAAAGQDIGVRLILGTLFAALILFRRKPDTHIPPDSVPRRSRQAKAGHTSTLPNWLIPAVVVIGTALVLIGIIFGVHQFEWLGFILVLYGCLQWALPIKYSQDIFLSLLLFYWVHPLPGQIFGTLQLTMQRWSVLGSEWLLHCANVRVWADELILRTGVRSFGVPESCSGMRTSVTVLLCGLGTGVLLRFKWHEIVSLIILGLVQVLVLNVFRIWLMVVMAGRMPAEWAATFLHDTMGMFLLAAIFLTQLEAYFWRTFRSRQRAIIPSIYNTLQLRILRWSSLILAMLLIAGGVAAVVFKSRPYHRAMMIHDVVDALVRTNLEAADRASAVALSLAVYNEDLRIKRVQVLLLREKFEEALAELEKMPQKKRNSFCTILEAWGLMGLNRLDEAIALVNALPEHAREQPGVAMVRAEFAALQGDAQAVADNIRSARNWYLMVDRVRALFPYLADCEQWEAIAKCRSDIPYKKAAHALIAVHAHLEMNELAGAGEVLKRAMKKWPMEPKFLKHLLTMAIARPGSEWETLFADGLKLNVDGFSADKLAIYIENSFRMSRPDLAWLAYRRLEEIDPRDPVLYLAPAQFGDIWFTFRKHHLGIAAASKYDTIDLESDYRRKRKTTTVPLATELNTGDLRRKRSEYLQMCLDELDCRERAGNLSSRMQMMYPTVLELAGQYDEAHARLDAIEKEHPKKRKQILLKHAGMYERQGSWEKLYEILREYSLLTDRPRLSASLMRVNALINLDFGVYALAVANKTLKTFPATHLTHQAIAAIWAVFGFPEEALFLLQNTKGYVESPIVAELLSDTERFVEAKRVRGVCGMNKLQLPAEKRQRLLLPRAELTLKGQWEPLENVAALVSSAEKKADMSASPFIQDLYRLKADWYRKRGVRGSSDLARWMKIGRDHMEKAIALNELTMLLARQKRYDEAAEVVVQSLEFLPDSPILWRVWIALTGGKQEFVTRARQVCPSDPAIWLAWLVVKTQETAFSAKATKPREVRGEHVTTNTPPLQYSITPANSWAVAEIERAIEENRFSVGTMVRAGDFMRRHGMLEAAAKAARHAVRNCQGLLPAYILGLRCALDTKDMEWALSCMMSAAENALDPWPYFKLIAEIKTAAQNTDKRTVDVLEKIVAAFPEDSRWVKKLGDAYLRRGDTKRALTVLSSFVDEQSGKVDLHALMLAVEAARREGKLEKAISILGIANARYPSSRVVLNNLVYILALHRKTLPRAQRLLPKLLEMWRDSLVALDTAAVVCRNANKIQEAEIYLKKAMELVEKTNPGWLQMNPTALDIDVYSGKSDDRVDEGMSDFEKFKRTAYRDELLPLAKELERKVQVRAGR